MPREPKLLAKPPRDENRMESRVERVVLPGFVIEKQKPNNRMS